uniref:Uncharacterized protein n=1 Tax=Setaria digitata TaxID=48799 RepID=A0A915Q6J7_9BILA
MPQIVQRVKQFEVKSPNVPDSVLSTSKVENNKPHSVKQSVQTSPPPLPNIPPPQLPSEQFISLDDHTLGVITQRQWTTAKNSPSVNIDNKSRSAMSAKVETTVRQWSTPMEKVIEGQPPRPVSLY